MVDEPITEELPPVADDSARPHRHVWLRRGIKLGAFLLLLVVGYVAATFVQVWHATGENNDTHAEAIVVLGAAQYNGRPSRVLEARLAHALTLYRAGDAPLIVVTGGREPGDRYTEGTTGYNWLRAHGVPDQAILKEVHGRDTWESLAAVARFLRPRHVNDVILVSDPTHSLRLDEVAAEVGLHGHVSPQRTVRDSTRLRARTLLRETEAVSLGRIIGYRRLSRLVG